MGNILNIIWIIIMIQIFITYVQKRLQEAKRLGTIRSIEKKRQSRVITMIHRQETMNLLQTRQQRPGVEFILIPY